MSMMEGAGIEPREAVNERRGDPCVRYLLYH